MLERGHPIASGRSAIRLRSLSRECPFEQERDISRDAAEAEAGWRWLHLHGSRIRAVCKAILANRTFHRHLTGSEKPARERMPSHEQHLENDDR